MFDGYRRAYLTIYLTICMNSEQSVLWSLVSMHTFISTSITKPTKKKNKNSCIVSIR